MNKTFIIGIFLFVSSFSFSALSENKILNKAEEHFQKKEWKEASEIYNIVLNGDKGNISLYAPSIIAAGKCNNYNRVISYISISENSGIPLDSVLKQTLTLSLKTRNTDIYENTLLLIKEKQPWLKNFVNNHLLDFYFNRKNNIKCIEIADAIIEGKPKNITDIMIVKAKAMNDIGDINSAVSVMEEVLNLNPEIAEARLFLGYYYFLSAKQSIKDGNFTIKLPQKRGKKSEEITYENTDIYSALKRAKSYLDIHSLTNKRPYVKNIIKEIDAMISAFESPISSN
ncbi:MAG: hypothetical protein IJA09_03055 [Bacteroidales bacterium]|nr:hypothetical protein [Bacteroidales bacterium]